MARLEALTLTFDMSPFSQFLFDVEPLDFDFDNLVIGNNSFDVPAMSFDGQDFLFRVFFTQTSPTQGVLNGFDLFNADGSLAVSVSELDFVVSILTNPFDFDLIDLLTGDDGYFGASGDDVVFGGPGNDTIDGRGGTDTAIYLGTSDQYQVLQVGGHIQVSDLIGGRDGIDLLSDIELYQFSNGNFSLSDLFDVPDIASAVYRFFNTATNTHFYTADPVERDIVIDDASEFVFEGPAFKAVEPTDPGADPVFRFFNSDTSTHFYTISADERDAIVASLPQFTLEGPAYFAHDTAEAGTIPLFRFFNSETGTHFYTADAGERDVILETLAQFDFEGTAYFVEAIA